MLLHKIEEGRGRLVDDDDDDKISVSSAGTSPDGTDYVPDDKKGPTTSLVENLARQETRAVALLRITVIFVLLVATGAVSYSVYRYMTNEEQDEFEKDFNGHAHKVMETVELNLERQLSALSSFGVTLTSFAHHSNSTWPFVTLPDFERRVHSAVAELNAIGLLLAVKVEPDEREQWDEYSVENVGWVFEGLAYQQSGGYGGHAIQGGEPMGGPPPGVPGGGSGPPPDVSAGGSGPPPGLNTTTGSGPPSGVLMDGSGPPAGVNTTTGSGPPPSDSTEGSGPPSGVTDNDSSGPPPDVGGGGLPPAVEPVDFSAGIADSIWALSPYGPAKATYPGPWWPQWQNAPAVPYFGIQNLDFSAQGAAAAINIAVENKAATMGGTINFDPSEIPNPGEMVISSTLNLWGFEGVAGNDPIAFVNHPVFETLDKKSKTVGFMTMYIHWRRFFVDILPANAEGVLAVVENTCNETFSFRIDGMEVEYLGPGDHHDSRYNDMEEITHITRDFNERRSRFYSGAPLSDGYCDYSVRVFPSNEMEDAHLTNAPLFYTLGSVAIFFFTSVLFLCYDSYVERRQRIVMRKVTQTGNMLDTIFPEEIRDQLILEQEEPAPKKKSYMSTNHRLQHFLRSDGKDLNTSDANISKVSKPIANLFPHTTVMFADVANFTSWASTRDAAQIFQFLQAIYSEFDVLAERRNCFKVESVGDCYVAVAGLPSPQPDHFAIISKFAQECLFKFNEMTRKLEPTLGPDTGDLQIRLGLHSGPCTAGVLRGARSRFQLFGETVNMAVRMEAMSVPNRIQVSSATAELLIADGKSSWVKQRDDEINVKGKGNVKTYWLVPRGKYASSQFSGAVSVRNMFTGKAPSSASALKKKQRLIAWNVETLSFHLKKILARRQVIDGSSNRKNFPSKLTLRSETSKGKTALDEVQEAIDMPTYSPELAAKEADPESIILDSKVIVQLQSFVSTIASLYRDNDFHNFEHASHVSMGVDKLLNRVVTPDIRESNKGDIDLDLHDYTYGITSDPLTHFAVVLSALVHDVDHRGISNQQMVKEEPHFGALYRNKSVAEQNSIDLAWDVLMQDEYEDLRRCIYSTETELRRFRQIVLQVVLATDIFDKELNDLRKGRWNQAFAKEEDGPEQHADDTSNLKATIVIEHMIQASDVSHTMQHWHVYRKWNRRLFRELYAAYRAGRMGADPSNFWYSGELSFFDNYIIPLARKLKDCGVFGVSSDEFLVYARANREEWQAKGKEIVAEMMEELRTEQGLEGIISESEDPNEYDGGI